LQICAWIKKVLKTQERGHVQELYRAGGMNSDFFMSGSTKKLGVNLGALVKLYRVRIKQYRNNLKLRIYKE